MSRVFTGLHKDLVTTHSNEMLRILLRCSGFFPPLEVCGNACCFVLHLIEHHGIALKYASSRKV